MYAILNQGEYGCLAKFLAQFTAVLGFFCSLYFYAEFLATIIDERKREIYLELIKEGVGASSTIFLIMLIEFLIFMFSFLYFSKIRCNSNISQNNSELINISKEIVKYLKYLTKNLAIQKIKNNKKNKQSKNKNKILNLSKDDIYKP
jgi:hypothetical protein